MPTSTHIIYVRKWKERKRRSFIELKWNILLEEGIETMKRGLNMQEGSNPHMGERGFKQ